MGTGLLMPSFIAIIVGGIGSLPGTLAGGLLIGLLGHGVALEHAVHVARVVDRRVAHAGSPDAWQFREGMERRR